MLSLSRGMNLLSLLYCIYPLALLTNDSIPIHERVELPEELIPADSRVEIDAKITAGMPRISDSVRLDKDC